MKQEKDFGKHLMDWYQNHKRDLPWREKKDPYSIWVSEIMLQQTRVEAVREPYKRFLEAFPDVETLAMAKEEEVHKLWEGLGYYRRATNLWKGAQMVCERWKGNVPSKKKDLSLIPGIGEYTSGAIASIAFGERVSAVDGNMVRIFSRLDRSPIYGQGEKGKRILGERIFHLMEKLEDHPGDFNEALMDLGATICLPQGPECEDCPVTDHCEALAHGEVSSYPPKIQKKKRKKEKWTVLHIHWDGKILIEKRGATGLLAGLYQYPNVEGHWKKERVENYVRSLGMVPAHIEKIKKVGHIFTHVEWDMWVYEIHVRRGAEELLFVSEEDLTHKYSIPTAFQKTRKERKS
ncbi:MAG: A/G-specific adenine glycosylase [Tissierellia bacterium]|nr:A/G-specific adenine glycosylase [Tissierellia bacterium]